MAFLIVASITIPVAVGGATSKALEKAGSESRSFSGSLRSTTRWTKRSWQFTTRSLTDAAAVTIETAVNGGAFVTCSGDALGGSVTCHVAVGDGPFIKTRGTSSFKRALVLTLREV